VYGLSQSTGASVYGPAGNLGPYVKDTASVEDVVADIRQLLRR